MVVPASFYIFINLGDEGAMRGWAIPTATDIAFALGVLAMLGKRVPLSLKIFLMALAIIDDLGAIIIIVLFYTVELSTLSIVVAATALSALIIINRLGVAKKAGYVIFGVILWVSVLKSGVHATLAGVALAFTDGNLYQQADKLAILTASFTAGITGYLVLRMAKYNN